MKCKGIGTYLKLGVGVPESTVYINYLAVWSITGIIVIKCMGG